jgi:anti-sigma28 factor (negative regulator of flagellin synthesis)
MSVWTTKALNKNADYIVIRHSLRGINSTICGVRFRDSYGVVERNSKTYTQLKRMPVFKGDQEYDLTFLLKLPFITRPLDIKQVYGHEVYVKYLQAVNEEQKQAELAKQAQEEALEQARLAELAKKEELEQKLKEAQESEDVEKVEEIKSEIPQVTKCSYVTHTGKLCKYDAWDTSPSGYCKVHVVNDPKLEELGIKKPGAMTKSEKRKFRKSLYNKLEKLKKSGAF